MAYCNSKQDDIELEYKERAELYKALLNVVGYLNGQLYYQPDQKIRVAIETHIHNLLNIQELLRMIFTHEVTSTQIGVSLSALRSAAKDMTDEEKKHFLAEVNDLIGKQPLGCAIDDLFEKDVAN